MPLCPNQEVDVAPVGGGEAGGGDLAPESIQDGGDIDVLVGVDTEGELGLERHAHPVGPGTRSRWRPAGGQDTHHARQSLYRVTQAWLPLKRTPSPGPTAQRTGIPKEPIVARVRPRDAAPTPMIMD